MPRYRVKASVVVVDGSLSSRLLQFFIDNPDEELTMRDAAEKFDVPLETMQSAVYRLASSGALQTARVIRLPAKGRRQAEARVVVMGLHDYDLGKA